MEIIVPLRKKQPAPAPEAPAAQVIDVPIMPCEGQLGQLQTPDGAYAVVTLSTMLQSGTYMMDRSQAIRFGSELLKLGEKMPKPPKKIEVVGGGLVVPG